MGSDTAEFWGGTPGGENQAVWNLQTVTALLSGAEPLDAILRPKWGLSRAGSLVCEEDHPMRQGIGGDTVQPLGLRSALQVLRITPEAGVSVAAEPRTGAVASAVPARDDCRRFPLRGRRSCGSARHARKT